MNRLGWIDTYIDMNSDRYECMDGWGWLRCLIDIFIDLGVEDFRCHWKTLVRKLVLLSLERRFLYRTCIENENENENERF